MKHTLYRISLSIFLRVLFLFRRKINKKSTHIFYGGAFSGLRGGPRVKIGLLQKEFPEHFFGFNLVYLTSGALYLSKSDISFLAHHHIPIIMNQNGVAYPAWTDDWQYLNDRMAHIHTHAAHVFYQSDFCKRSAEKWLGVTPKSWEILYNGVDTDFFTPPPQKEYNNTKPFTFLHTGNIRSHQIDRLKTIIEGVTFARHGGLDVRLSISGMIPKDMRSDLATLVSSLNMDEIINFLNPYTRQDAPHILKQADAYITTSYNDACPNAVLEAMACGLPILYSHSGGVPELVGQDAGVGLPVPLSYERHCFPDPKDIADGIQKIITNHANFSVIARSRAENLFSLKNWLARHHEVFRKLQQEES